MNSRFCTSLLFGLSVCLSGCAVMKGSNPLGRMMHSRGDVAGMEQDPFVSSPESSAALVAGTEPATRTAQPGHVVSGQTATAVPPGTTIPHASPGVRQIGALPPAQPTSSGSCTLTDGGPSVARNSRFASRPAPLQSSAAQPSGRVRLTGTTPPPRQGVVPVAWNTEAPAAPTVPAAARAAATAEVPRPLIPEPARQLSGEESPPPAVASAATQQPSRAPQTASVAAPFPERQSTATSPGPLPRAATTGTAAPFPETAVTEADAPAAAAAAPKPPAQSNRQPTAMLERTSNPAESTKPGGTVSKTHRPASPRLLGRAQAADSPGEAAPGENPFEPADSASGPDSPPVPATDESWKPAGSTTRTSDSTDYWPAPVPADAGEN